MNNNPADDKKNAPIVDDITETPNRKGRPFPVRSISEIIDDDFDLNSQAGEETAAVAEEDEKDDCDKEKTPETDL